MPAKKSSRGPSGGKQGAGPASVKGAFPEIEYRSPLLGPDPAISEEVMFDLGQFTSSRLYASIDDLNADLARLTAAGPVPRSEPMEPQARAQRLVYDAWKADSEAAGLPFARRALALDPDCADAHLYLAVHAADIEQVLKGAFQAVDAGARWLEREKDKVPEDGQLWRYVRARPYLRSRVFLARCLWTVGGRIAAVTLLEESLQLDEGDGLGCRYLLLGWCLDIGEEMLSQHLVDRYKQERSAFFLYADALLAFWEGGADKTSSSRLKRALKANPHVPDRLLDHPPDIHRALEIDAYRPGSEEEADLCAQLLLPGWERDTEALDWLEEALK